MNPYILLRTSFLVIKRHPGRSFLTVLGIMIGILAIIVTFSIGRGAEQRIKAQILALGENSLYIIPGNVIERGRVRSNLARPARLTQKDMYAIKNAVSSVKLITPGFEVREQITRGTTAAQEHIFGTSPAMLDITDQHVAQGMFFTNQQVKTRANVIVLGDVLAKILFKKESPLNKIIRIKRLPFMVIGVLAHKSEFWGTEDPNKRGYIPWTTAKKYFKKPEKLGREVDFVAAKLGKEEIKGEGLRKIARTLRQTHEIEPGGEDDFTIFDQQSIAQSAETASEIIQLFGLLAASISLLVGGIGIMNIMLVSVYERTREIGIRLAIGATRRAIQAQFLIEALTLCLVGGIIGILTGIAAVKFLSTYTTIPGIIELKPLLVSLIITFLVGLFFGYFPARQASRLNPVDALYHR
ncbi:MAG: ABC transporter permease [Candidatus Babeliaceae bacterium]|nr:ABC transporter permease [Candidatus Babeliaceae bacterium]